MQNLSSNKVELLCIIPRRNYRATLLVSDHEASVLTLKLVADHAQIHFVKV